MTVDGALDVNIAGVGVDGWHVHEVADAHGTRPLPLEPVCGATSKPDRRLH